MLTIWTLLFSSSDLQVVRDLFIPVVLSRNTYSLVLSQGHINVKRKFFLWRPLLGALWIFWENLVKRELLKRIITKYNMSTAKVKDWGKIVKL